MSNFYWQDIIFYIILIAIVVGFFCIKKPQPPGGKRKSWIDTFRHSAHDHEMNDKEDHF